MPAGQPVLAEGPLDPGHPGHREHLDQQQVGGDQAGEPAGGGERRPGAGRQVLQAARPASQSATTTTTEKPTVSRIASPASGGRVRAGRGGAG